MREGLSGSRSSKAVACFLLVCALLISGVATDHARAAAARPRRQEMLALTNEARAEHGRDALSLNERLSRYATRHSREMAKDGCLFHTPDLASRLRGLHWSIGGENVGYASSLRDLQRAFMASKPHRRNILREQFEHAAIGVVQSDGNLWVTVIFYG
jgi:uncharacterized protein YkwD